MLPVGENDRLVGTIADRDIAIRAVAAGKGPDTPVRDIMSKEVSYCFEDDEIDDAAEQMADAKLAGCRCPAAPSGWSASCRWVTSRLRTAPPMPAKRCAIFPSPAGKHSQSLADAKASA